MWVGRLDVLVEIDGQVCTVEAMGAAVRFLPCMGSHVLAER